MKLRFNSFDIVCGVTELQALVGLRVNQIYDIDNKTYLIRLQGGGEAKKMLLIESGIRFHTTAFEWPKNMAPSGFSMKLRKHLKNKRLEKLQQLGVDRIVDFQFGIDDAAYHIIVELYDRGNIVLTDHEMTILYILRPHQEGEDIRFAVREKYPCERVKKESLMPIKNELVNAIKMAKPGDSLRRVVMPMLACGPTVIEHVLTKHELDNCVVSKMDVVENTDGRINEEDTENKKAKKSRKNDRRQINTREFIIENDIDSLILAIQVWADFKVHTKQKLRRNKIDIGGTGGGPSKFNPLTPLEEKVVELLNMEDSVNGLSGALSFGTTTDSCEQNNITGKEQLEEVPSEDLLAEVIADSANEITGSSQNKNPRKRSRSVSFCDRDGLLKKQVENQINYQKESLSLFKEINENLKTLARYQRKEFELREKELNLARQRFEFDKENAAEARKLTKEKLELKKRMLDVEEERLKLM